MKGLFKWLFPWRVSTSHPSTGPVYPQSVQEIEFQPTAQPVYLAGVINTTQNKIRNAGLDTLDEFWFRNSSYNMTNWALWYNAMLEFFTNHNAQSAQVIVTNTDVDSASDATHTLTCPSGHAYKVTTAVCKNSTRTATWTLDFTPSGGTAMQVVDTGTGGTVQGESCPLIGTGGNDAAVDGIIGPVWLQAGDVLTITNTNFVASDVVEKAFIIEDYTL